MKKNKGIKITAFLALFAIIIGIIGTGLLIIFDKNNSNNTELTSEQYEELMKKFNSNNSGSIETQSGNIETQSGINIGTGNIEIN